MTLFEDRASARFPEPALEPAFHRIAILCWSQFSLSSCLALSRPVFRHTICPPRSLSPSPVQLTPNICHHPAAFVVGAQVEERPLLCVIPVLASVFPICMCRFLSLRFCVSMTRVRVFHQLFTPPMTVHRLPYLHRGSLFPPLSLLLPHYIFDLVSEI